jgi:glyoxylase-like metal-dependent hydrolase (beta-lactamase superfamily II)
MIKVTHYGAVTRFDMARNIFGRGRYWTSAYLVDDLLIDTGCAYTAAELAYYLAGTSIQKIVNTHTHEDHIGANAVLQRFYSDLKIFAHPLAIPILADPRGKQPLHPYRRAFWGWPDPCEAQPLDEHAVISTPHYQFQVLFTPGHSQDHLCLYEPNQQWLFSGDLFVGGRDRALRSGCDIWGVIDSLKMISRLPLSILFAASARVRTQPADELVEKIKYYERMGEKVLQYHQQGRRVADIARRVFGGPFLVELITLGHFSRRHLVFSYLTKYTTGRHI